jgi:hypothetical protein
MLPKRASAQYATKVSEAMAIEKKKDEVQHIRTMQ